MLSILSRNSPAAVVSLKDEDSFDVIVRLDAGSLRPTEGLAVVARGSEAGRLLEDAFRADECGDHDHWRALPLRYGPLEDMWVLSDAVYAPAAPGGR
jgi:hypothetical protein